MYTKTFKELTAISVNEAGGKGASLGEMTSAGIPVPPGFVVTANAFDRFLAETGLGVEIGAVLSSLNYEDVNSIEKASEKIRDMMADLVFPPDIGDEIKQQFQLLGSEFVAVRSSATAEDSSVASWAGELDSFLNTKEDQLLDNVKRCWSSLFTPRAIFYRFEKNLQDQKVSVAVVVQKMVQSEVSGIAFTVHPVTEDYNQMIIEAGFGLGEAIVSGSITPDSYVVLKSDLSIQDVHIADQTRKYVYTGQNNEWVPVEPALQSLQKLDSKHLLLLAELCLKIERHYGFPCDIEWAMEQEQLFITQSRPITTLK